MKVVIEKKYQFEEKEKIKFRIFLYKNKKTYSGVAYELGISVSYLTAIVYGTRYASEEIIERFNLIGFKLNYGRKSKK